MRTFDSISKVAEVINARAQANKEEKEAAAEEVEKQKQAADQIKAESDQKVVQLQATREQLIAQLAAARGVTEQAEQERQAQIEAAEEAARQAAAEEALAQAEAAAQAAEAQRQAEAAASADSAAQDASSSENQEQSEAPQSTTEASAEAPAPQEESSTQSGSGSSVLGEEIVAYAKQFLGVPYVWGGNGPNSFDCSGLTSYVYRHFGINLPRTSQQQRNVGQTVSAAEAQPGDMVNYYTHVGIYIGNGMMIHAPKPGSYVQIVAVYGSPIYKRVL